MGMGKVQIVVGKYTSQLKKQVVSETALLKTLEEVGLLIAIMVGEFILLKIY